MRASLWPSCCPLGVVVFVIRHTKRNKTWNIYFAFLMLNYLWYICRAFFSRYLLQSASLSLSLSFYFLTLFHGWFLFFAFTVFFAMLSVYFVYINLAGGRLCLFKETRNDVRILRHRLSYKLYDEVFLLFTCLLLNITHGRVDPQTPIHTDTQIQMHIHTHTSSELETNRREG